MTTAAGMNAPMTIVMGGDTYLNEQATRDLRAQARRQHPQAQVIELNATDLDRYAFEEATGPSLFSDESIVVLDELQNADESLGEAMVRFCADAQHGELQSIVVARHEGGVKGKRLLSRLLAAGAREEKIPDLKRDDAKLNFVMQQFERHHRSVSPEAAQELVAVLGGKTGELAAMCEQLCFDFDEDPIAIDHVDRYLTANPQVTGFSVADKALAGRGAEAIIAMRAAIEQGTDPIAMIGALAMKLRTIAKASAVRSGAISQAEAKTNPWVLKNAMRQLGGWSSEGLGRCIQMLAWADEQSKTSGGDPIYALERSIELISDKGRAHEHAVRYGGKR